MTCGAPLLLLLRNVRRDFAVHWLHLGRGRWRRSRALSGTLQICPSVVGRCVDSTTGRARAPYKTDLLRRPTNGVKVADEKVIVASRWGGLKLAVCYACGRLHG